MTASQMTHEAEEGLAGEGSRRTADKRTQNRQSEQERTRGPNATDTPRAAAGRLRAACVLVAFGSGLGPAAAANYCSGRYPSSGTDARPSPPRPHKSAFLPHDCIPCIYHALAALESHQSPHWLAPGEPHSPTSANSPASDTAQVYFFALDAFLAPACDATTTTPSSASRWHRHQQVAGCHRSLAIPRRGRHTLLNHAIRHDVCRVGLENVNKHDTSGLPRLDRGRLGSPSSSASWSCTPVAIAMETCMTLAQSGPFRVALNFSFPFSGRGSRKHRRGNHAPSPAACSSWAWRPWTWWTWLTWVSAWRARGQRPA
jgi:hypothetical protein